MATRDPQSPARSALGTGTALGGGGLVYWLASALGATPELSVLVGGLLTAILSVLSPWARDLLHTGSTNPFLKLLAQLGAVVLAVSLGGCAINGSVQLGPDKFKLIKLQYQGEGMGTFCWSGAGWRNIGIRPVGWGPDECSYSPIAVD